MSIIMSDIITPSSPGHVVVSIDIIAPMSVRKKNNETKRQNEQKIEGHIDNRIAGTKLCCNDIYCLHLRSI